MAIEKRQSRYMIVLFLDVMKKFGILLQMKPNLQNKTFSHEEYTLLCMDTLFIHKLK